MTVVFRSFAVYGRLSKAQLFMINTVFRRAPTGFATWALEQDKSPGITNLRENRAYAHEVAAKLIKEKRQELESGTSRRDLLSLLGSSCVPFTRFDAWCDI